jgi:surface polysaccharide O-acyltransferase-like enzyme
LAVILFHTFSGVTGTIPEQMEEYRFHFYETFRTILAWCVPIFVLISGALFLNPEKEIPIKALFFKYIRRMFFALCVFGIPMTIIEAAVIMKTFSLDTITLALYNFVSGHNWAHMWYLYMIIGLYLCVPIFKLFVNYASVELYYYVVVLLCVFTSIIPFLNSFFKVQIGFYLPINSIYVVYLLLGHLIHSNKNVNWPKSNKLWGSLIVLSIAFIIFFRKYERVPFDYSSPIIVLFSVSLFSLFKNINFSGSVLIKYLYRFQYLCFGIYVIHGVFINLFYKGLRLTPLLWPDYISIPVFFMLFAILSAVVSYIMNRIPLLRKYVL